MVASCDVRCAKISFIASAIVCLSCDMADAMAIWTWCWTDASIICCSSAWNAAADHAVELGELKESEVKREPFKLVELLVDCGEALFLDGGEAIGDALEAAVLGSSCRSEYVGLMHGQFDDR